LRGHVSSQVKRYLAQDQLQGLVGMSALHNELVAVDELAAAVSMALAHDPRTAGQHVGVYPRLGEVHLRGSVQTSDARERAGAVAWAVGSVTSVVNELHVDPTANEIPELSGVTNNEDRVPGGR
jgi:osmotically-inducible protein OsmY